MGIRCFRISSFMDSGFKVKGWRAIRIIAIIRITIRITIIIEIAIRIAAVAAVPAAQTPSFHFGFEAWISSESPRAHLM